MAPRHLQELQLDRNQIETAVDFFESYASLTQSSTSGINSENALVDAASSLRAAGQWAMFIALERAIQLLAASAQIWHRLGYGFGTYLLAAFMPDQINRNEMVGLLIPLAQPYIGRQVVIPERRQLPEPLRHPNQQAYLLLAEAGMSRQMDLPTDLLHAFADQSPHRRGVVPIGSLGIPLRVYWDIARRFLERDEESSAEIVGRDLARMAASYAETIDSAMANQRLWFNAAAPVDVGDIDTIAIALLAARRLGFGRTMAHLRSTASELGPIEHIPLELAIEMIERYEPGPENTSLA